MNLENIEFVDSLEQVTHPLYIGNFVRIKSNLYDEKTKGRKAQIIDFDDLSNMGSNRDRWTIRMCKSKTEYDVIRETFEQW